MHAIQVALLFLQALVVVEAASVKWTLHSSCYRTKDGQRDDDELAKAMIDAVTTSKAWAKRGSKELIESTKFLTGIFIKKNLEPLLDHGKYDDNAKAVAAKFDKLADLEGPIGQNGPAGARYDASTAWIDLAKNTDNYNNFLIVCRPELVDVSVVMSEALPPSNLPYDKIRKKQFYSTQIDFKTMLNEENDPAVGDWNKIKGDRLQAITSVDDSTERDKSDDRKKVPETITFHPLWLKFQRDQEQKFNGWTDKLFEEVTRKDAPQTFEAKGKEKGKDNVVPMDGLLDRSFVRNIFHEFFHLTYFGGMGDDRTGAYGWHNNVSKQNKENPDYYAIIAAVIELLNRDGRKYKVDAKGAVSRK